RWSMPAKTLRQRPQRTKPRRSFSWSGTTRKLVLHCGQVVASAISLPRIDGRSSTTRSRQASPSVERAPGVQRDPAIAARDLVGLPVEQPGENEMAPGRDERLEQRREHAKRVRKDVR